MRPPAPPRRVTGDGSARPPARPGGPTGAPTATSEPAGRAVAVRERRPPGMTGDVEAGAAGAAGWSVVRPGSTVSTRLADRLAERTHARRRLTWLRLAALGACAVVGAVLAYVLLFSPLLALDAGAAQVSGLGTTVDPGAVGDIVQSVDGIPLARLDTRALTHRIGAVSGVKSVEVSRDWPSGLTVTIVSREPVAAAPRDDGFALLDPEGVQVGTVDVAPETLPTVDVPEGARGADALRAVLTVLGGLPPELLAEVSGAGASSGDTVRFRLHDGSRVEWGSAESSALKLRVLEVLRQRPASVYDVSAPTMPVTR